jgi:hypothetical protein
MIALFEAPPSSASALIAAASACVAAAIAGAFSLAGLFISKEQDTSKFRQAWIDDLRKDIAALIAHAHQIHSYMLLCSQPDNEKRWAATKEDFLELNKASTRIKLRVNQTECESRLILQSMSEMEELFKDMSLIEHRTESSLERIHHIVSSLERNAPPLLKKEWTRVKDGEPIYRWAKAVAGAALILSSSVALYFFSQLLKR